MKAKKNNFSYIYASIKHIKTTKASSGYFIRLSGSVYFFSAKNQKIEEKKINKTGAGYTVEMAEKAASKLIAQEILKIVENLSSF